MSKKREQAKEMLRDFFIRNEYGDLILDDMELTVPNLNEFVNMIIDAAKEELDQERWDREYE